jgi:hypothetical protein
MVFYWKAFQPGGPQMLLTPRTVLFGMSSLLAAPALVRATSLDYVPRHKYYAYEQIGTGVYDVIRGDGQVIGWLTQRELRLLPDRSHRALLAAASADMSANCLKVFRSITRDEGTHESPIPLNRLVSV